MSSSHQPTESNYHNVHEDCCSRCEMLMHVRENDTFKLSAGRKKKEGGGGGGNTALESAHTQFSKKIYILLVEDLKQNGSIDHLHH